MNIWTSSLRVTLEIPEKLNLLRRNFQFVKVYLIVRKFHLKGSAFSPFSPKTRPEKFIHLHQVQLYVKLNQLILWCGVINKNFFYWVGKANRDHQGKLHAWKEPREVILFRDWSVNLPVHFLHTPYLFLHMFKYFSPQFSFWKVNLPTNRKTLFILFLFELFLILSIFFGKKSIKN